MDPYQVQIVQSLLRLQTLCHLRSTAAQQVSDLTLQNVCVTGLITLNVLFNHSRSLSDLASVYLLFER